jgi:Antitoxin VbhA
MMAVATLPVVTANEIELDNRRLAVESALGSLRIEGMELEPEGRDILDRFANGEMTLPEMRSAIRAYTATIV